jgi:hypothetical protein
MRHDGPGIPPDMKKRHYKLRGLFRISKLLVSFYLATILFQRSSWSKVLLEKLTVT